MQLNVFKLNTQLQELTKEKAGLLESLNSREKDLEEARKLIDELTSKSIEHTQKIEVLTMELGLAKNEANRKAAEILATVGVPEGTVKESTQSVEPSAEELFAQYKKLMATDPKAATEFYRKNRAMFIRFIK